jgi:hypothetical protein
MEYFAGLDVAMAETQVCVVTRDGARHPRGESAVYVCRYRGRARASTGLAAGAVRNRPDGANALPWLAPTRTTRRLRREPAGLSGAEVVGDAQDRPLSGDR